MSQKKTIQMSSSQNKNGRYVNHVDEPMTLSSTLRFQTFVDYFKGSANRAPNGPPAFDTIDPKALVEKKPCGLYWLGHSSLIIRLDGKLIITDPVFSQRASPVSFAGPKSFHGTLPISVQDLPMIDAALISHDHYDHLDYETIVALKKTVRQFFVPLGVATHLVSWGIAKEKIVECDWWETVHFGSLQFTATPTQHFSGRGLFDRDKTLWCSWVIKSKSHKLFFGGDSGYFSGFKEIGERYGPFDLTMLECGAYSVYWPHIHMMPEQTAQAHSDLRGKILLPIHWGKFNLSLHSWTEPIERLSQEAALRNISLATPRIGSFLSLHDALKGDIPSNDWWKE